jgi:carbonic anhydrase
MAAAPNGELTLSKRNPAMKTRLSIFLLHITACLSLLGVGLSGCAGVGPESSAPAADHVTATTTADVTPAQAKVLLVKGNARFVSGQTQHPHQTPERRTELAAGQHPFAAILGCSDSRTGPEILFDQGLGDLFVVREAGNVVDDHAIGSIEYAVEHLHLSLIVVLGHQRCGAVAAAREVVAAKGHAEGHIESLVVAIRPAVEATIGQDAEATCKANIRNVVRTLRTSEPMLRHMVESGDIKVVGAYYDLDTGVVTFLPD